MKGLTHLFFGIGFVGFSLSLFEKSFLYWGIGTLIITPIFSRIPDHDQKIAKITFNQIVPHRSKFTHNLLYGFPLFFVVFLINIPFFGQILAITIISIFGAIFAHAFIDAFNYGGVWFGVFKIKGFLEWDSFLGNFGFKLIGVILFILSLKNIFLT
ncbi:MAG: metal-dependent hydrolase [Candidatus Hodarchaeota archaeon]